MNPITKTEYGITLTLCAKKLPFGGHCGNVWVDVTTLIRCDVGCYTDDKFQEFWPLYKIA